MSQVGEIYDGSNPNPNPKTTVTNKQQRYENIVNFEIKM